MASASSSASPPHLLLSTRTQKHRATFSATASGNFHGSFRNMTYAASKLHTLKAKAAPGPSDRNTKPNSVICGDCDGNGAVICSQCTGSGVNSVISSMDSLKLASPVGFVDTRRICCAEIATALASLGFFEHLRPVGFFENAQVC